MDQNPISLRALLRRPSAYLPLAMSAASLAMLLGAIVLGLIVHKPIDRAHGSEAIEHLFQILMTVQWPIMLFFAIKWLRRAPRPALRALALQAGAWFAACAPVYFLHL